MKKYIGEVLIVIAIGAISGGAWMIYEPAGVLAGGVLTGVLGIFLLPLGAKG